MARRDIIVIGGSTGSGAVLRKVVSELPADLRASLFVTTHIPPNQPSHLVAALAAKTSLKVATAVDGQPVQPGHIYVAPQDRHLLLGSGFIRLGTGPRENHVRPAVDPMFRSAALAYGARVVGVIISGLLHDGASGLSAIKQVGGTAVVQHPRDAVADEMPIAALEAVEPDHLARADELGPLLAQIAGSEAGPDRAPDEDLAFEVEVAAGAPYGSAELRRIADPVTLTCPDCQGVLSEVRGARPLRYRCQIGHAFTAGALIAHDDRLSEAIRVAMRVMEERVELVSRMARDARQQGRTAVAQLYESRAEEFGAYAATLRAAARETIRSRPEDGGQAA